MILVREHPARSAARWVSVKRPRRKPNRSDLGWKYPRSTGGDTTCISCTGYSGMMPRILRTRIASFLFWTIFRCSPSRRFRRAPGAGI